MAAMLATVYLEPADKSHGRRLGEDWLQSHYPGCPPWLASNQVVGVLWRGRYEYLHEGSCGDYREIWDG